MTQWAFSIARFTGKWVNKIINHQNFDFQLLSNNFSYQTRQMLMLSEDLNINYLDIEKNEAF